MNVGTKDCGHQIAMSTPSAGEAGATGEWRTVRPVLQAGRCLAERQDDLVCQLCWVYCPDVCIQQGIPPTVDLRYCKGCGICAELCPVDAIRMVSEHALPSEAAQPKPEPAPDGTESASTACAEGAANARAEGAANARAEGAANARAEGAANARAEGAAKGSDR